MSVSLTGLDGTNPLGFLAALGTLVVLDDRGLAPTLRWTEGATWHPVIEGAESVDQVVEELHEDMLSWPGEPALRLPDEGRGEERQSANFKLPRAEMAGFLRRMRREGERSAALAVCLATDVALDNNGLTKPTALNFMAGRMKLLATVHNLATKVNATTIESALCGPWEYVEGSQLKLRWDVGGTRTRAYQACKPADENKRGVVGAEWLAFLGLRLLPVVPRGAEAITTCVTGSWNAGSFTWPLWVCPLSCAVAGSLLQQSSWLGGATRDQLRVWGIGRVLRSRLLREGQGYGKLTPPEVLR